MGGNIPNPVGCGVLRIGMIKGFFGVGNFGKYFFGWRDLCRDILRCIQNNLKIHCSAPVHPGCIVLQISSTAEKSMTCYISKCFLEIFNAQKFGMGLYLG